MSLRNWKWYFVGAHTKTAESLGRARDVALRESLVPAWYPVLLAVLVAPGAYSVVAAGDQMTSPIRAAHELSIRVSEFLFR